mgnify:CR=1 FL=1
MFWIRILLFGLFGLVAQVAFGSLKSLALGRDRTLSCNTSLWFVPLFALIALAYPFIYFKVSRFGLLFRGLSYMFAFFIGQYVIGWLMDKAGIRPWSHDGKLAVSGGLIDFAYAPVWFFLGLGIERIWPYVTRMASHI